VLCALGAPAQVRAALRQSTDGRCSFYVLIFTLSGMPDTSHLRPATAAEIADALSFALRYQGRKRVNHADDMMARITADRLVQHLTESGFVLMKGTAAAAPSTLAMPLAERD
jgi:hypothetical protein